MINNIKGEVSIKVYDIELEKYIDELNSTNDVCFATLQNLFFGRSVNTFNLPGKTPTSSVNTSYTWRIIGNKDYTVQSIINHGVREEWGAYADANYPTWTPKTGIGTKDTFTVVCTLGAPSIGTTRTIRTLGLTCDWFGSGMFSGHSYVGTLTNLSLTTPCIQTDTQVLSITYRLYFDDYVANSLSYTADTSRYELLRLAFKNATEVFLTSTNTYNLLDYTISSGFYKPENSAHNYYHHMYSASSDSFTNYFNQGNLNYPNINTSKVIYNGCEYRTITIDYADSYRTGTFIRNYHLMATDIYSAIQEIATLGYQNVTKTNDSPIQNIFKHKNGTIGPFQTLLLSELSTMSGNISLDANTWTVQKLPKLFRIIITNNGEVGTATYKIESLAFTAGFLGNTFSPKVAIIPQDPPIDSNYSYLIKDVNEKPINKYINGGIIYRKMDEISKLFACHSDRLSNHFGIYDIIDGSKFTYSPDNLIGFTASAISDGEYINDYIFISCANTGLWKIHKSLSTVTKLNVIGVDDTKCYAICKHNDGSIWALFEGGLGKSTDLGNTWTIYNSSSTPILNKTGLTNNWSNCISMVLDDEHPEYRFLFLLKTASSEANRFVWWSTTTAAISPTTVFELGSINNYEITDCCKCIYNRFYLTSYAAENSNSAEFYSFTFNSSVINNTKINNNVVSLSNKCYYNNVIKATIAGVEGIIFTPMYYNTSQTLQGSSFFVTRANVPTTTISYTSSSPTIEFFFRYGTAPFNSNLSTYAVGNNLLGVDRFINYFQTSNLIINTETPYNFSATTIQNVRGCIGVRPFTLAPNHSKYDTYKNAFWKSYGWDGSGWVEGNPNSKTTHSTSETFLDGLKISFSNGSNSPSFINSDFFTFVVGDGIMKDNATTMTFGIPIYNKETEKVYDFSSPIVLSGGNLLVDEPVCFCTINSNNAIGINQYTQKKGIINYTRNGTNLFSEQLIPSSTTFDLRFKRMSTYGGTKQMGLCTYASGTTYNYDTHFYFEDNGDVKVRTSSTTHATILASAINIDSEFKITRDASNVIRFYYDNNLVYNKTSSSQFIIYYVSGVSESALAGISLGFRDIKLTYTENRPFVRIGNSTLLTGSYNSRFAGTTTPQIVPDKYLELDNIPYTLVHKTAGESIGALETKVATGSGWLIFNVADVGKSISGYLTCHYLPE